MGLAFWIVFWMIFIPIIIWIIIWLLSQFLEGSMNFMETLSYAIKNPSLIMKEITRKPNLAEKEANLKNAKFWVIVFIIVVILAILTR